jgi:hypothetical protein
MYSRKLPLDMSELSRRFGNTLAPIVKGISVVLSKGDYMTTGQTVDKKKKKILD